MATFSKNRVFGKLINQYEINGVSYSADTIGSITVGESGPATIAAGAGTTVYATTAQLPVSGNNEGDQAFVSGNNRLYIWNGSGWYNIALINTNPSISSITDSDGAGGPFVLSIEGIPTTITIVATDPEGLPITYTAETDSAFDGIATISQDSSVFTITPFGVDSAIPATGSITFRASDGVNIASSIQSFSLNFLTPYWKNTILSVGTNSTDGLANSTYVDKSSNAVTLSVSGTPDQSSIHPYLENWSVYLDGNDHIIIPNSTSWQFGTGDYTLEAWINLNSLPGNTGYYVIAGNYHSSVTNWFWQIRNDSGQYKIGVSNSLFNYTFETNTWYHVVTARTAGSVKTWVNGSYLGSISDTSNYGDTGQSLRIGAIRSTASGSILGYFPGYISNLRITKSSRYSAVGDIVVPTEKYVDDSSVLLFCQSNRFIDNSTENNTFTLSGDPVISNFNPFGQESEYASGQNKGSISISSGEMVNGTGIPDMVAGIGAFTYEAWVNTPSFGYDNGAGVVYTQSQSGQNYLMLLINTSGYPAITYGDGGGTSVVGTTAIIPNTWNHIAWVRENTGTDGFKIYLNGEVVATGTVAYNFSSETMPFAFGRYPHESLVRYFGYISDFKYTKSAVYTSAFTPPISPVGNTNATLYVPFDNAGVFDKTGNNILTLAGNTSSSITQTKYTDTAVYFDGSGDYISCPSPNLLTNDFTIEAWINMSTINSYSNLFAQGYTSAGDLLLQTGNGTGRWILYLSGSTVAEESTGTINTDQWYHIAVVRSGTTFTIYRDGVAKASGTSATSINTADNFIIGLDTDNGLWPFTGYIEGFQILKGVAKYTANFTPPTGPQGRTYQAES